MPTIVVDCLSEATLLDRSVLTLNGEVLKGIERADKVGINGNYQTIWPRTGPMLVGFSGPTRLREVTHDFYLTVKFSAVTNCIDRALTHIKTAGEVDTEVARKCKHCASELLLFLS